MSEKIGKLYNEAEIIHVAAKRRFEDSANDVVIWGCDKCLKVIETPVSAKITSKRCNCGRWMQWHYRPKQVA